MDDQDVDVDVIEVCVSKGVVTDAHMLVLEATVFGLFGDDALLMYCDNVQNDQSE